MRCHYNVKESVYIKARLSELFQLVRNLDKPQFSNGKVSYSTYGLFESIQRTLKNRWLFTDDLEKFNSLWKGHNEGNW